MRITYPLCTLLAISAIWGSTWIPNQYLEDQGAPCALAALRFAVAAVVLAILGNFLPNATRKQPLPANTLLPSLLLGFTMMAAPILLMTLTARHGAGAWTPLLYAALPLGLSIADGELQPATIVAVGTMFLFLNGSLPLTPEKLLWTLPTAATVALQGWSLLYACKNLRAVTSLHSLAIQFATAAVLLAAASLMTEAIPRLSPARLLWTTSTELSLAALAVLATAVAYPLYYLLLHHLNPAQLGTSQWLQTLVAAAEGAWLLHQRPSWIMLAAAGTLALCTWSLLHPASAPSSASINS